VKTINMHSLLIGFTLTVGAQAQAIFTQTPNLYAGADEGSCIFNSQVIAGWLAPAVTEKADTQTMWGSYLLREAALAT